MLTIDRIDNKKGYSPDNCRWTDKRKQSINRTITRFIEVDGEKYTIPELAEKYGINKSCLYARAKKVGYNAKILEDVSVPKHFYKGKEYTLAELSRETGISSAALLYRIKAGWNADDLGNTPRKTGEC